MAENQTETTSADKPEVAPPSDNTATEVAAQTAQPTPESAESAEAAKPEEKAEAAPASTDGADDGSAKAEPSSDEMSFAEMFELAEKQSEERRKSRKEGLGSLKPGQVIDAKIVGMSNDSVFLDVGAKAEGVISKSELLDENGEFHGKEGDVVEARVRKFEGGTIVLSKVLPHQSLRTRESLREAHQTGIPIEGRVNGQNKGGFDIDIAGLRAFCPASQIDIRPLKGENYLGKKFPFRLVEFKDGGKNIVVSRRALLEEERRKKAEEVLKGLEVGSRVHGAVTSLKDYGAFVDLGGLEGLVHLSEITHGHINKPGEVLKVGQQIMAEVLKIEDGKHGNKKISLSMKRLIADPWLTAQDQVKEGQKIKGKVARIQTFGAFVELFPGVDGLIHVSNMTLDKRVKNPRDIVKEGDEVEATVVSVDWSKRRIGLSLVKTRQELANELSQGQVFEGSVDKIEGFGLFVKLPSGARGLVPAAETGTQRGADLSKEFNVGGKVKVLILDSDKKSGKIRLSIRQAREQEERAEYAGYINTNPSGSKGKSGLGTLGDLFKGKFPDLKQ